MFKKRNFAARFMSVVLVSILAFSMATAAYADDGDGDGNNGGYTPLWQEHWDPETNSWVREDISNNGGNSGNNSGNNSGWTPPPPIKGVLERAEEAAAAEAAAKAEEERRAQEAAARAEAEAKAKAEAEAAARAEAERIAAEKAAAEKAEAERLAQEAAAKAEAERIAAEKAAAEAAAKAEADADAAAKAEAERLAKEAAAKAEAERLAKEAAEKAAAEKAAAEAEAKAKAKTEAKDTAEVEAKAKAEAELRAWAEATAKAAAEARAKAEAEGKTEEEIEDAWQEVWSKAIITEQREAEEKARLAALAEGKSVAEALDAANKAGMEANAELVRQYLIEKNREGLEERLVTYAKANWVNEDSEAAQRVNAILEQYPVDSTWGFDDAYVDATGKTHTACSGFAYMLADAACGYSNDDPMAKYEYKKTFTGTNAANYVRQYTYVSLKSADHAVFVLSVDPWANTFTAISGNVGGYVDIKTYSLDDVRRVIDLDYNSPERRLERMAERTSTTR